jgi:ECF transporter S component (folate family)
VNSMFEFDLFYNYNKTKKIILCGLILAIVIVLNRFEIIIPYGATPIAKISLGDPLCVFIAIALGGFYGGSISMLNDFINSFINPIGNYIFLLNIVSFFRGYLIGLIWTLIKKSKSKRNILDLCMAIAIPDYIGSILDSFILKIYLSIPNNIFRLVILSRLFEKSFVIFYTIAILILISGIYKKTNHTSYHK